MAFGSFNKKIMKPSVVRPSQELIRPPNFDNKPVFQTLT